jgi:ribosomal protein S18
MYKQIIALKRTLFSANLGNKYASKSKNILRNRYSIRKRDNLRHEYNESITLIPPEYADQDEYLNEKEQNKKFEEIYKSKRVNLAKKIGLQLPSKDEIENIDCQEIKKQSDNDQPVTDIHDPYTKPMQQCIFCKYNIPLDYKNVQLLSQFVSPITGFLYRQEVTGLCWPKYDELDKVVRKARFAGLMPFRYKFENFINDPRLFHGLRDSLKDIPENFDKTEKK